MKMIDIIARQILDQIESSELSSAEIKRNEMAELLGCVPSQINYCLSSRFTPERGYIVESRRGGGGFIRITRVKLDRSSALMHIINSIGDDLDISSANAVLDNCVHAGLVGERAGAAISGAISSRVMREIPAELRDKLRAILLKQMLVTQI